MFRHEEDAFLRKGGDYSRNCLSYVEEEEEASKNFLKTVDVAYQVNCSPNQDILLVSAAGKCTEPFVKSLNENIKWNKFKYGEYGIDNDNKLVSFICPSVISERKRIVDEEKKVSKWLLETSQPKLVIIFTTSPTYEQQTNNTFEYRTLSNGPSSDKPLESTRYISSYSAAILEYAMQLSIPTICYIVPRDPVLSKETLLEFRNILSTSIHLSKFKSIGLKNSDKWIAEAIKGDEKESRKTEPEGMFS